MPRYVAAAMSDDEIIEIPYIKPQLPVIIISESEDEAETLTNKSSANKSSSPAKYPQRVIPNVAHQENTGKKDGEKRRKKSKSREKSTSASGSKEGLSKSASHSASRNLPNANNKGENYPDIRISTSIFDPSETAISDNSLSAIPSSSKSDTGTGPVVSPNAPKKNSTTPSRKNQVKLIVRDEFESFLSGLNLPPPPPTKKKSDTSKAKPDSSTGSAEGENPRREIVTVTSTSSDDLNSSNKIPKRRKQTEKSVPIVTSSDMTSGNEAIEIPLRIQFNLVTTTPIGHSSNLQQNSKKSTKSTPKRNSLENSTKSIQYDTSTPKTSSNKSSKRPEKSNRNSSNKSKTPDKSTQNNSFKSSRETPANNSTRNESSKSPTKKDFGTNSRKTDSSPNGFKNKRKTDDDVSSTSSSRKKVKKSESTKSLEDKAEHNVKNYELSNSSSTQNGRTPHPMSTDDMSTASLETTHSSAFPTHWNKQLREYYGTIATSDFTISSLFAKMPDETRHWKTNEKFLSSNNREPCQVCFSWAHKASYCPIKGIPQLCIYCGDKSHRKAGCPNQLCLFCGTPHAKSHHACERCLYRKPKPIECDTCGVKGHPKANCPDNWRAYHSTTISVLGLKSQQEELVEKVRNFKVDSRRRDYSAEDLRKIDNLEEDIRKLSLKITTVIKDSEDRRVEQKNVPKIYRYCCNCGSRGHTNLECGREQQSKTTIPYKTFVIRELDYNMIRREQEIIQNYHRPVSFSVSPPGRVRNKYTRPPQRPNPPESSVSLQMSQPVRVSSQTPINIPTPSQILNPPMQTSNTALNTFPTRPRPVLLPVPAPPPPPLMLEGMKQHLLNVGYPVEATQEIINASNILASYGVLQPGNIGIFSIPPTPPLQIQAQSVASFNNTPGTVDSHPLGSAIQINPRGANQLNPNPVGANQMTPNSTRNAWNDPVRKGPTPPSQTFTTDDFGNDGRRGDQGIWDLRRRKRAERDMDFGNNRRRSRFDRDDVYNNRNRHSGDYERDRDNRNENRKRYFQSDDHSVNRWRNGR